MLKLISLALASKYNDSIDSLSLFSFVFIRKWNLRQLKRGFRSIGVLFPLLSEIHSAEVHVLDKHNRELFYKDIKSNAIMVSYDCSSYNCCIPSMKLLGRSFAIATPPIFLPLVRSNYQLKSTQTLYALRSDRANKERTISITYVFDSSKAHNARKYEDDEAKNAK